MLAAAGVVRIDRAMGLARHSVPLAVILIRASAVSAVFEYVEAFYNRQRRHSTLGMLSPVAYEQQRLSTLDG